MSADIQGLFATARRLQALQEQPPLPLAHRADRPRDGPCRHPDSFQPPGRSTGQIRPSQRISRFSYHSKGKS